MVTGRSILENVAVISQCAKPELRVDVLTLSLSAAALSHISRLNAKSKLRAFVSVFLFNCTVA